MRNFKLMDRKIEIQPLLAEMRRAGVEAWAADTRRQNKIPALKESEAIVLREVKRNGPRGAYHQETYATPMLAKFPRLFELLCQFAASQKATLTKITIARLLPQSHIFPHIDPGGFFDRRDRFHLVLAAEEGNCLRSGGETVSMKPGELWWFDNKKLHSASNFSDRPRVHVIFDLLPWKKQVPARPSYYAPMCADLARVQFALQAKLIRWNREGGMRVRGRSLLTDKEFLRYSWSLVQKQARQNKAAVLVFTAESRAWAKAFARAGLLREKDFKVLIFYNTGLRPQSQPVGVSAKALLISLSAPEGRAVRQAQKALRDNGMKLAGLFSVLNFQGSAFDRQLRQARVRPEFLLRAQDLDLPRISRADRLALKQVL